MKFIFGLIGIVLFINANEIEVKGNIGVEYKTTSKSLTGQLELTKALDEYSGFLQVEMLNDKDDNARNYSIINEAYLKYENENLEFKIGRDIKYWGALEVHNLTDIYNLKNLQYDKYDKDQKLGSEGITLTKYYNNEDEISFIANRINNTNNAFIKYSGSRYYFGSVDFNFIASHNTHNNKLITYDTVVVDDTLVKIEYSYTDSLDENMNNYYEGGIGFEHTLYSVIGQKDFGLIVEYYKSDNSNLIFENDFFTGARFTFNDIDSSDVVVGIIQDVDTQNESYSFEYNTRIFDKFKTKISYMENISSKILGVSVGYYF